MEARREAFDRMVAGAARLLPGQEPEVHDAIVPVKGGEISVRVYVPPFDVAQGQRAVLVWGHGGGWILGSIESEDCIAKDITIGAGMIVVSVSYRLSPETKFPMPVKDFLEAFRWVRRNIARFGGDSNKIAIGGESAGGNVAMGAALASKRWWQPFGKIKLCALLLASPVLSYDNAVQGQGDGDGEWRSYRRYWKGYGLEGDQMAAYWSAYLKDAKDGEKPLASPLRASKRLLGRLPPVLLIRAEHEVLWDEISEMGRKLNEAGVEVTEYQMQSSIHGMFMKAVNGQEARDSLDKSVEFLRCHCG